MVALPSSVGFFGLSGPAVLAMAVRVVVGLLECGDVGVLGMESNFRE